MKKLSRLSILAFSLCAFHAPSTAVFAQDDSLVAPEVLDVDDPFRRGLDRIADQATGGVTLPLPDGPTGDAVETGEALLGLPEVTALIARSYRVVGVAVSRAEAQAQIFSATNQDVMPGNKPMLAYVRLGIYTDQSEARQIAINLKSTVEHLLGAHFVMRGEGEDGVILDIGPMRGVVHAERYCELLLSGSNGLVSDCYAALEYPGLEPVDTFSSKVMLKAAASAVKDVVKDADLFDLSTAASKLITLREGDMIGAGNMNIVKVTPRGVIIVAENGDIEELPIDYVPERAYTAAAPAPVEVPTDQQLPDSDT